MRFSCLQFTFMELGNECKSSFLSVPLILFISLCSHQQMGFCLGTKYTFCQNDSSSEFYRTLSHHRHWRFSSINLLRFLNVISKLFPCCGLISCFVHNWFLSRPYLFEQLFGSVCGYGLYSGCLFE